MFINKSNWKPCHHVKFHIILSDTSHANAIKNIQPFFLSEKFIKKIGKMTGKMLFLFINIGIEKQKKNNFKKEETFTQFSK